MHIARTGFISLIIAASTVGGAPLTTAAAAPKAVAAKADVWDGTWSGRSSNGGRQTTVRIAKGKVTFWTNNGFPRPKVTGSVTGKTVRLDDNNGWKATMTLEDEDTARLTASGIGNNGKPAKNSAVLTKR